jgi:hypothetical protein
MRIGNPMKRKLKKSVLKIALRSLITLVLFGSASQSVSAKTYQYHGLIDLDYGSSIPGAPKHSRYFIDFTLDASKLDSDHSVFENDIYNAANVRGLTTFGNFDKILTSLRFTLDTSSVGSLDLSGLNFDPNYSYSRVVDANEPPPPPAPPCDIYPCIGEHITLAARDITPGSPVTGVWLNLYNSNFYDPIYASRQLLLDTSASGDPFSFADLFLHGPETLVEFQSYRTPDIQNYRDPVMMTGPNGTVASGRFLSLAYVQPVPAPLPMLGVGAALAWSRRLRRRISDLPQGTGLKRQICDHPEGR